MIRAQPRVVATTLAIVVALAGIFAAFDGLLFESNTTFRYGAAALIVGIAGFVLLLNPGSPDHG